MIGPTAQSFSLAAASFRDKISSVSSPFVNRMAPIPLPNQPLAPEAIAATAILPPEHARTLIAGAEALTNLFRPSSAGAVSGGGVGGGLRQRQIKDYRTVDFAPSNEPIS